MATLPSYETVKAREDQRAAAFLACYKGRAPSEVLSLAYTTKMQRVAQALTPYRPGLPPEDLIRLHTGWEAYSGGHGEGTVYDFYFDDGVLCYKLHEEPVVAARPVSTFPDWDKLEFRPWGATWEDTEIWLACQREQELTKQGGGG